MRIPDDSIFDGKKKKNLTRSTVSNQSILTDDTLCKPHHKKTLFLKKKKTLQSGSKIR